MIFQLTLIAEISAVFTCSCSPEQVWFYDKRKWANKKLSTALAKVGKAGNPEGGGCCIWYDEPRLLTLVEKRMTAGGGKPGAAGDGTTGGGGDGGGGAVTKIQELGAGYVLPEGMAGAAAYGEARDSGDGDAGCAIRHPIIHESSSKSVLCCACCTLHATCLRACCLLACLAPRYCLMRSICV